MMHRYLGWILVGLFLVGTPPAHAGIAYHYMKSVVKSLDEVSQAQQLTRIDKQKLTRRDFIKIRGNLQKALKKLEAARIEIRRYQSADDAWVQKSIKFFEEGFEKIIEIYEKGIEMVDQKLNQAVSSKNGLSDWEIRKHLRTFGDLGDTFYNGAAAATYAVVDMPKKKKDGYTHLKMSRSEMVTLRAMVPDYFLQEQTRKLSRKKQPAEAALYTILSFLQQDWKAAGEEIQSATSKSKIQLFSSEQLQRFNATT